MILGIMVKGSEISWAEVSGTRGDPFIDQSNSTKIQFPVIGGDDEATNLSALQLVIKQRLGEAQGRSSIKVIVLRLLASGGEFGGGARLYKIECVIQLVAHELGLKCKFLHPATLKKQVSIFEKENARSTEDLFPKNITYWTTGLRDAAMLAWFELN